jgi:protein-L-isoaspartate(D-aspartate) O-methyltransferase
MHAGTHPVLSVAGPPAGPVSGRVVCGAGFMSAAGPLNVTAFPAPAGAGVLTGLAEHAPARFDPELEPGAYRDLWYAAGAWDRRASHATIAGDDDPFHREHTHLALLDGPGAGAVILPDGRVLATGEELARAAGTIIDRWVAAARPPMQAWRIGLAPAGPVWAPSTWEL